MMGSISLAIMFLPVNDLPEPLETFEPERDLPSVGSGEFSLLNRDLFDLPVALICYKFNLFLAGISGLTGATLG
jgi:hypothetical protein